MRWLVVGVVVVALGVGSACAQRGSVDVTLSRPSTAALDPLDDRLATLTLVTSDSNGPLDVTTKPAGSGGSVAIGQVAVEDGVMLSVSAREASGRLIGYARTAAPVHVMPDKAVDVSLLVRRPFAYVTGANDLWAFDTTLESGGTFGAAIALGDSPASVTTSPDGANVIVGGAGGLQLISTSNHTLRAEGAPLAKAALESAVSPDGRFAVVSESGAIEIIDLTNQGVTSVPIAGANGAVAVGAKSAYVLVGAAAEDVCGSASAIQAVPLDHSALPALTTLNGPARDIAWDPGSGFVVAAEACRSEVDVYDLAGGGEEKVFDLPRAATVAVSGGRVWAMGSLQVANGAHLILMSSLIDGRESNRVDLPVSEELAQSDDLQETGESTEARLAADDVDPYDMAVLPGGAHVAALVHGKYHADDIIRTIDDGIDPPFDQVILPSMDLDSHEFLLLDAASGVAAEETRADCSVMWDKTENALLNNWSCAADASQEVLATPFTPLHIAVLYGDR